MFLIFAAPPPGVTELRATSVIAATAFMKPVGGLTQAVIFAEIVILKQRLNVLNAKILTQKATINAAMRALDLHPDVRKRIVM